MAFYITKVPRNAFTAEQYAVMQTISRHFVQQEDAPPSSRSDQVSMDIDNGPSNQASMDIDNVNDTEPDMTAGAKKGRGRPRKSSRTRSRSPNPASVSWGVIQSAKEINMDNSLKDLLRNFTPDNAAASLDASRLLPTNPSVQPKPDMNVFSSFCRKVYVMPHGTPTKHVARLFMVLAAGDMGSALCGDKLLSIGDKSKDIMRIKKMASSLLFICEKLGNGCLFHLENKITDHL